MKHNVFVLVLLLVVSCAHVYTTTPSVYIDGTWKGVYDSKGKDGQLPKQFILKLKSDGDTITGTGCDATARPGEWIELKEINIKGNNISFTSTPIPGMDVRAEGKIEGDIMKITFNYNIPGGVFSDSVTLKREK